MTVNLSYMRLTTSALIVASVLCLGVVACTGGGGSSFPNPFQPSPSPSPSPAIPTAPPAPTPTPRLLALGDIIGTQVFANGDTALGGQGSPVDGIPCDNAPIHFHIHSHVTLFQNGTQVAIPIAIGLMNPVYTSGGNIANTASCFYHVHTHDRSGIIHQENPTTTTFTVGNLFDIWGEPLTNSNIAGVSGPTLFYIGTSLFTGDPRTITFTNHEQVTLEVGGPYVFPPFYTWSY
jgi:hypothetical protein